MKDRWHWLSPHCAIRVGVITSRRELTNSTVVIADRKALLIDPAWDPDELAGIAADLATAGVEVVAGFSTHAHHDHLLWHPGLGGAPRWASPRAAADAAARRTALLAALGPQWPPELGELVGRVRGLDADLPVWPGPPVRMITHEGHAPGHTALWLPDSGVLVAGDMLSDVEIPLLEGSGVGEYQDALAALRPFAERATALIPGHGHVAMGTAAVRERVLADERYLAALRAGREPIGDPRLDTAGMRQAHRENQARASAG